MGYNQIRIIKDMNNLNAIILISGEYMYEWIHMAVRNSKDYFSKLKNKNEILTYMFVYIYAILFIMTID